MAAAGGIRAGRAFVELYADASKLVAGLRAATARLRAFGSEISTIGMKMLGLGTAVATPLMGAGKVYANVGRDLDTLSQRTGISVEALSALQYAANRVDVQMESLIGGIARMQRQLADATAGEKDAIEALDKMGVKAEDLLRLPVEEQLRAFADRIGGIQDPALRTAAALEVFGRGGAALLPLLNQGGAGMQKLMDRAKELGLVISSQDAKAANEFALVLKDLWATVRRGVFAVGSALAPVLQSAAEWIRKVVKNITDWVDTHKEVIQKVLVTAGVVAALGAGLMVLGKAIIFATSVLKGIGTMLAIVKGMFAAIGVVLGALASPLGIIIGALTALGGYLLWASGTGAQALNFLGQRFALLGEHAAAAWRGIADAFKAGDLELAAKIAWNAVQLIAFDAFREIREGLSWLRKQFNIFLQGLGHGFLALAEIIRNVWERTVNSLARTMTEAIALFGPDKVHEDMWKRTIDLLKEAIDEYDRLLALRKEKGATPELDQQIEDARNTAERYQKIAKQMRAERKGDWRLAYIQKRFDDRAAAETKRHTEALANIGEESLAGEQAADKAHKDRLDAIAAEGKRLREERDKLLEEANWKRFFADIGKELDEWIPKEALPTTTPQIKTPDVSAIKKTVEVVGTFSGEALRGVGVGPRLAERTAKAAEETAKNTKKVADKLDDAEALTFT